MKAISRIPSFPVIASGENFAAKTTAKSAAIKNAAPRISSQPRSRKSSRRRLLWIGDAVVPTGFATVTHGILAHLHQQWDVTVSGVNYDGSAHTHPYRIQPAWQGGDMWGMDRFAHLCAEFAPAAVVINSDWWHVSSFLDRAPRGVKLIAYMPVDGANMNREIATKLDALDAAVWYTRFGCEQARRAGFKGPRHVVPHGIDTSAFRPLDRSLAREALGLPQDAFIVGNVNRNQPRKRLDVTVRYFAEWVKRSRVRDARLLLHCARQDTGWDLGALAAHHGISGRVIFTGGQDIRDAAGTTTMPLIYSALDVQVSTTLGEGWGLTTMEGMACGVPQIVPGWAALGEWAECAIRIPCSSQLAHPEINTIGALPDMEPFIDALDALHRSPRRRTMMSRAGLALTGRAAFRWENVASQIESIIEGTLGRPQPYARSASCAAMKARRLTRLPVR